MMLRHTVQLSEQGTMTLDKATREAIAQAVRKATVEMQEVYQEQWLTGEQLCEAVPLFTKEWLHRYGQTLPRECVRVTTTDGVMHKTGWCYPKMKILRMLAEGDFRGLQMRMIERG